MIGCRAKHSFDHSFCHDDGAIMFVILENICFIPQRGILDTRIFKGISLRGEDALFVT